MRSIPLHILFAFLFSLILFPFIGYYSIVVFLSGFVFDIDHYLYYAIKKKDIGFINGYLYHVPGSKVYEAHHDVLHIFHTWEVWMLFLILTIFHKIFLFSLIGLLFHMILDQGYLLINFKRENGARAWSLIGWLMRN
ncbi:hypothetical protein HYT56_04815 [Candidatus Woesearchaeota archaeon]|nr:hypothetical protein [Candidatus Woesearchaeota archaeon]